MHQNSTINFLSACNNVRKFSYQSSNSSQFNWLDIYFGKIKTGESDQQTPQLQLPNLENSGTYQIYPPYLYTKNIEFSKLLISNVFAIQIKFMLYSNHKISHLLHEKINVACNI